MTSSNSFGSYKMVRMPFSDDPNLEGDDSAEEDVSIPISSRRTSTSQPKRAPLQRHDIKCQLCLEEIRGDRWLCLECKGWSACGECFGGTLKEVHPLHTFVRARGVEDIYSPPSDQRIAPVVHMDVLCSSCHHPIVGVRYECLADDCIDFNLCQSCETLPLQAHKDSHPVMKYSVDKSKLAPAFELVDRRQAILDVRRVRQRNKFLFPYTRTMKWDSARQTITCAWPIQGGRDMTENLSWEPRRLHRPVNGTRMYIDDSKILVSLSPGRVAFLGLEIVPSSEGEFSNKEDSTDTDHTAGLLDSPEEPLWFSETWQFFDAEGNPRGERLSFAFKFNCTIKDGNRHLVPILSRSASEVGLEGDYGETDECVITSRNGNHKIDIIDKQRILVMGFFPSKIP
jgi:hypothetical protein